MSKRMWLFPALLAFVLVLGSGAGFASMPSLLGGTGIVSVPNAMVAPAGQVQTLVGYARVEAVNEELAAIDFYEENPFVYDEATETANYWTIQALAGLDGAELWAAFSKDNSDLENTVWSVGGKYQFPACASNTNFAIGAAYRSGDGEFSQTFIPVYDPFGFIIGSADQFVSRDATNWDVYLAATVDLTAMNSAEWCGGGRLLGTAGIIYKKFDADLEAVVDFYDLDDIYVGSLLMAGEFDDSLTRPFVAVEYLGQDRTSLGLEYRWKDNNIDEKAVFSAVLRHEFEGGFTGQIGVTNANQFGIGLDDQNWFVAVGYNFGICK